MCEAHGDETRARGRMRQKATPFLVPTGTMIRMTAAGTWTLRGTALEREGRASGLAPPGYPHGRSSYPRTSTWHAAHQTTQNFCGAPRVRARARGYRPWSAAAPTCRSAGKLIAVWFDDKSRKVSSLVYLLSKSHRHGSAETLAHERGPGPNFRGRLQVIPKVGGGSPGMI